MRTLTGFPGQAVSAGNGTQSTSPSNELLPHSPLHWLADGDVEMWGNSVATQAGPDPIVVASADLKPHWNESFLSCVAAGLQGACRGPVYLCNKVIRGSVITRPSHCTFSLLGSPILSSVPVSSPPLPPPSLFHRPKKLFLKPHNYSNPFRWPLLTWRICLMWWCGCAGESIGGIKQNVYCLKGSFRDSGFRSKKKKKSPYLYLPQTATEFYMRVNEGTGKFCAWVLKIPMSIDVGRNKHTFSCSNQGENVRNMLII